VSEDRKKKIPVCLKNPDAIYLQYGDEKFKIDMGDFESYIVSVYEEDYERLKSYLTTPKFLIRKEN